MYSPDSHAKTGSDGGLARLAYRMRTEGLSWLRRRMAVEAALPTTFLGQTVHFLARRGLGGAAALPRAVLRIWQLQAAESRETLFAFYDLKVAPVTFDFLWFLVASDLYRRRRGLKSVHVVIVPGSYDGVRKERDDYEAVINARARQLRIQKVLVETCRLLPSLSGLTLAASRHEAATLRAAARRVIPIGYEPALPDFPGPHSSLRAARAGVTGIACLQAPAEELALVDRWIAEHAGGRRIVTITLRRYGYMPARNSRIPEWCAFARKLDPARYLPVFVPDTNDLTVGLPSELGPFVVYPEAAASVALRMALYERAFLNLGVNNGPMGLTWLNGRVRYATFKLETAEVPQSTLKFMRTFGFEPGKSLPFATPLQEWVWEDDTEDVISRTFARLVKKIDESSASP